MERMKAKQAGLKRRRRRVRGKVTGTADRPRLCVTRTNENIYAQLIDDVNGTTVMSVSSIDSELGKALKSGSNADSAKAVGEALGKRAVESGIKQVVFDRSGRLYHGRVKALAEGARSAGLDF